MTATGPRWRRPWPPWTTAALVVALVAIYALLHHAATAGLTPRLHPDSGLFLELARRPLDGALTAPKPPGAPFFYRLLGRDPAVIAAAQAWLSFAAWLVLAATLVVATRRRRARIVAGLTIAAFALAAPRLGFTAVILSESLADSLAALAAAAALGLALACRLPTGARRTRACAVAVAALTLVTAARCLTRDTDALATLPAVALALALWRPAPRRHPWAALAAALTIAVAALAIWSAGVAPAKPMLSTPSGAPWPVELSARNSFPLLDNLLVRVLPDDDARAFFVARGLPQADDLQPFAGRWAGQAAPVILAPRFAPLRAWFGEHAAATYASWLFHHPLARGLELAGHLPALLAPDDLASYLPADFTPWAFDPTTALPLVLALLLAAPLALRHPRRDPLAGLALCLVAGAVVGLAAAYYGDAIEPTRHAYGAAQQLLLGCALALIGWLDRGGRPPPSA